MKLQKSTLALLIVAIALGGGVLLFETQKADRGEVTEQSTGDLIFDFEEGDVQKLTLERTADSLTLERDPDDIWRMTAPEEEPAEPAAIAFLLSILTSDPSLQTLEATPDQLEQFGLNDPAATLTLTLQDDSVHQLKVGGTDFSGDSLYVTTELSEAGETDAESEDSDSPIQVHVVSGGLTNAIERPVDGWLRQEAPSTESSDTGTSDADTSDAETEAASPEEAEDFEDATPEEETPEEETPDESVSDDEPDDSPDDE